MPRSVLCSQLLLLCLNLLGCASSQPKAEGHALAQVLEQIVPHFECVLLYDQLDKREKVSKTIDEASTIGERSGLSPSQIMSAYNQARQQATGRVLERAINLAAADLNRLPQIDGSDPAPKPEDELQAWKDVYATQCPDSSDTTPT